MTTWSNCHSGWGDAGTVERCKTQNISNLSKGWACYLVAPKPNLVCLMIATNGTSRPPDNPILLPSDHPIAANILNPRLPCPIFCALYIRTQLSN